MIKIEKISLIFVHLILYKFAVQSILFYIIASGYIRINAVTTFIIILTAIGIYLLNMSNNSEIIFTLICLLPIEIYINFIRRIDNAKNDIDDIDIHIWWRSINMSLWTYFVAQSIRRFMNFMDK